MRKHLIRNAILASTLLAGGVGALLATTTGVAGAWDVSTHATSVCQSGTAVIKASFSNQEAAGSGLAIDVTLGIGKASGGTQTVQPGKTAEFTFPTAQSSLKDASVTFYEKWANGQSGTDSVQVWVPDINCSVPVTTTTTTTTTPPPVVTTTTTTTPPPVVTTTTTTTTPPPVVTPTTTTTTTVPAPPTTVVTPPVTPVVTTGPPATTQPPRIIELAPTR